MEDVKPHEQKFIFLPRRRQVQNKLCACLVGGLKGNFAFVVGDDFFNHVEA